LTEKLYYWLEPKIGKKSVVEKKNGDDE